MFFTRPKSDPEAVPQANDHLREAVAQHMRDADETTVAIVGAVAGLLAQVAHADHTLTDAEIDEIWAQLSRIEGLEDAGVRAVVELLREHGPELLSEGIQACTRVLVERAERGLRVEVLDVLMDVAASDGSLSMDETNLLRRVCSALALEEADYLASQRRYRERLSVLK